MNVKTNLVGNVKGVWLQEDGPRTSSDVHIYIHEDNKVVVIGQNKNYHDDIQFSDLAVVFKNGEVSLQYNDNGKPKFVVVDPKVATILLTSFLETLKAVSVK